MTVCRHTILTLKPLQLETFESVSLVFMVDYHVKLDQPVRRGFLLTFTDCFLPFISVALMAKNVSKDICLLFLEEADEINLEL